MRKLFLLSVFLFACIGMSCNTQQKSESHPQAVKAAESWLALIDAQQYEASWQDAAVFFKKAVPQEKWVNTMTTLRLPLGKLNSRQVKSTQYLTSLPGAPDGEYVVIQFQTSFENKQSAIETVTPMKEKDGSWKVSGYFIK